MSDAKPKQVEIIVRALARRGPRVLVCRNLKHGHAYLPGGHVEPGETSTDALAREFLEECGVEVIVGAFALANENLFVQNGKPRHELSLVFHVEHAGGEWPEAVPSLEPKIAFEWVEPAAMPEAGLVPPAMLAWLLAGGCDAPAPSEAWISHRQDPD